MARPRSLTPEQHRQLAERHFLYIRLRLEAAKHSLATMSREFGVPEQTLRDYLNRKVA